MKIHVGTENPVKIDAVREALSCYELFSEAEVMGRKVASGVRAQPLTLDETILGAKRRAICVFPGSQYSVGLESGTHTIDQSKWMELTVCCWYGGGNFHYGSIISVLIRPPT